MFQSDVPFTATGTDHGIEQENRGLKVIRGIKEIVNSHQVLDKSFLTAAELGNMIKVFCETLGINDNQNTKRDDYYQLAGSKNTRIGDVENLQFLTLTTSTLITLIVCTTYLP